MIKYTMDNVFVHTKKKDIVYLGLSELFVETLNRVEYIQFPEIGDILAGDTLCIIDTINDSYDFACPVSGEVIETNKDLEEDPHWITEDTEYTGWICKIKIPNKDEFNELMTFDSYRSFFDEEEKYL